MARLKTLHGCVAENGEEIDRKEFEVKTLNGEEDLDLWIRTNAQFIK